MFTLSNEQTLSVLEIRKIGLALSEVANKMDSFSGDLFIDLATICGLVSCKKTAIVLAGNSHADEIGRFIGCESETGKKPESEVTCAEALRHCDESLGWDYAVAFHFEYGTLCISIISNKADKKDNYDISKFAERIYGKTGIVAKAISREEAEDKFKDIARERE